MGSSDISDVRPNILDVVKDTGFSRTTVSDALNGHGRVSAETKDKILEAAERLGYRPNRIARGLRTSETGSIALVIPDLRTTTNASFAEFYLHLIGAVAEESFTTGKLLVLSPPLRSVADALALGVDGAIVTDPIGPIDARVQHLREAGVPVVTYERDAAEDRPPAVVSDNSWHTETVLDHLRESGGTEYLLVVPSAPGEQLGEITTAFDRWCAAQGVIGRMVRAEEGDTAPVEAELLRHAGIDAILDISHPAAMKAAGSIGKAVPSDILIAAYVDSSDLALAHPSVTAIDLHPHEIGAATVQALIALRDQPEVPTRVIRGELRIRESTTRRTEA